jgi:hypothetical protein
MPPEQMTSSGDVDARADLWALGVLLYELVTGGMPFEGTTLPAIVANTIQQKPKPMHEFGVHVPAEFERLVLRCLEKNPDDRIRSVGEVASGLLAFAPPTSDASLDRIARIEATNPTIRGARGRRRGGPPGRASQKPAQKLLLVTQSEAPPPMPDAAPFVVKRLAPVVNIAGTLAGAGWEAPKPARPRRVIVLGSLAVLAVVGLAVASARLFAVRPDPARSVPASGPVASPSASVAADAAPSAAVTVDASTPSADPTKVAPAPSASAAPAHGKGPPRPARSADPRRLAPGSPSFRLN